MPRFSPIFLLLLFVFIILLVGGIYYWWLVKTQSYLGPMVATERIEVFLSPGERKVGYFVPGQKFTPTGEQEGDWIEVIDTMAMSCRLRKTKIINQLESRMKKLFFKIYPD